LRNFATTKVIRERLHALNAIPLLIALLKTGTDMAREQAAGALRNMALSSEFEESIVQQGALLPLVALLSHPTPACAACAAAAIRSICLTSQSNKRHALEAGAIEKLVYLVGHGPEVVQCSAAGALRNLALLPQCCALMIKEQAAFPLINLIKREASPSNLAGREAASGTCNYVHTSFALYYITWW
jgi:vacuolar protein 8